VGVTVVTPGGGWEQWWWWLAGLHLFALALLVPVALGWALHAPRRRIAASAFCSVLSIVIVYVMTVRPLDIPIDWVTIIHEGLGYKSVLQLYTSAVHAGASFRFIVSTIAVGEVANLHEVVWLNLLLAMVNAALFFHIAIHVTGLAWAVPWTLAFALNTATFYASFSELPTHLLALYFFAALLGWLVLNDPLPQPRPIRAAAYTLCAVLTLLAALTRPEVSFIGLVPLSLYTLHSLLGSERWAVLVRRLQEIGERLLAVFAAHPAAVILLCVISLYLSQAGLPWGLLGRPESAGLYPFNPSFFSFFIFLPMLLLPVGVSIAVLFGFVHALIHFRLFAGLALSLFVLVRTYFAAQDQFFETGRYLSYIFPAVFLLGLFGKQELDRLASNWRPTWRRAVQVGFLMTWLTRPPPGIPEFYLRPHYDANGGFAQVLLNLNTQREVRHLLQVTEKNPECVFIGRVIESYAHPELPITYAYAVFGKPVPRPLFVSEKDTKLEDVVARLAPGASCVRLYYGGDCNLTGADRCTQFIAGRRLIDEERFWSRIYNNPFDYGYAEPEVVLATYAWP